MVEILDFLKFFVPLAGAAFGWYSNERRKRIAEEYSRKEQNYSILIESLQGFYSNFANTPTGRDLKARFLLEVNKCWLYCPDEVIKKAYSFIETVHTDGRHSEDASVRENAIAELMLAIRRDLLLRKPVRSTNLSPSDFKLLKVN